MKIVIAVFLLLGAVGSGIAASQQKELYKFLAALISMILHLWFGVWILISL
jgi:hypothetical protein